MPRSWLLATLAACAVGGVFAIPAPQPAKAADDKKNQKKEIETAIESGLKYLKSIQAQDGHFEAQGGQYPTTMTALAGMTNLGDATVITGAGDSNDSAAAWAKAALARATGTYTAGTTPPATASSVNLLRPTPDTARLAYMMLASLGANRT